MSPHPPKMSKLVAERRAQVIDDAELLLADRGVDVTMDDLAQACGVGRRTLFRYFESREDLIAATIAHSYERLMADVFVSDPDTADSEINDPDQLIATVLTKTHRVAAVMGRAHWQVAADPESHGELGAAIAARRQARTEYVTDFCGRLWSLSNGPGQPPTWLADTFGLVESLFAYQGLQRDFGRTDREVTETTIRIMQVALAAALAEATAAVR